MSRGEIGVMWFGLWIFVLITTCLLLKLVDKVKPKLKGVLPRVEVYKRNYRKKKHSTKRLSANQISYPKYISKGD